MATTNRKHILPKHTKHTKNTHQYLHLLLEHVFFQAVGVHTCKFVCMEPRINTQTLRQFESCCHLSVVLPQNDDNIHHYHLKGTNFFSVSNVQQL